MSVVSILWCALAASGQGYSGGTGQPNDPYLIATAQDLIDLGNTPDHYDKHFRLVADIDLSGYTFDRAVIAPDVDDARSSLHGVMFSGVFEGSGHVIRHLCIEGEGCLGLFGSLSPDSVVSNLGLEDASVTGTGTGSEVGALAGTSWAFVTNCYSSGTVAGGDDVGGLIGCHGGSASNCYSLGAVTGGSLFVGGLMGVNFGNTSNCYSAAVVTGKSGPRSQPGGLIGTRGADNGTVKGCFWDVDHSGTTTSDGGVGLTTGEMQELATYLAAGWDFADESANGTAETWQIPQTGGYPVLSIFTDYEPVAPEGQGTPSEPFLIRTAQELGSVAHRHTACYRLEADVDLSGIAWSVAIVPQFAGRFDGNGHVIRHLDIQGTGILGLFGSLDANSVVLDLGLEGGSVHGIDDYIGSLAGQSDGTLMNCRSNVTVSGEGTGVGGLIGFNQRGTLSDSYSAGVVIGNEWAGGLIGVNWGAIADCYAMAEISGDAGIGGLVGSNGGTVSRCSSSGVATGANNVGGLIGTSSGLVSNCYSTVAATADVYTVGGLIGGNEGGMVADCYSTGIVGGGGPSGGLIGMNNGGHVSNCCSAVSGGNHRNGLVGSNSGRVVGCIWDMEASGVAFSCGGTGLSTAEMMDPEWIGLQGWANDPNWVLNPYQDYPRLAWEGTNGQPVPEPIIAWIAGDGTSEAPYEIRDTGHLLMIAKANLLWGKSFILMADLDLAEIVWPQAVIPDFSGMLDGSGHVIKNLQVSGHHALGLVGRLSQGGAIMNLGLVDVNIGRSGHNVGALVGENAEGSIARCYASGQVTGSRGVGGLIGVSASGTVSDCNSTCTVTGDGGVGGLVGENHGSVAGSHSAGCVTVLRWGDAGGLIGSNYGILSECHSLASVTAEMVTDAGGLAGTNSGRISNCYSLGQVTLEDIGVVGGLAGHNSGTVSDCYSLATVRGGTTIGGLLGSSRGSDASVSHCYSTGPVIPEDAVNVGGLLGYGSADGVEQCFWDVETSGQTTSAAGTGLITAELWDIETYMEAGWDFVGETDNGVEDLWWIDDGNDYPHLWWERL